LHLDARAFAYAAHEQVSEIDHARHVGIADRAHLDDLAVDELEAGVLASRPMIVGLAIPTVSTYGSRRH